MNKIKYLLLSLLTTLLFVSCSQAEDQKEEHDHSSHKDGEHSSVAVKPQKKCPIKGGDIDKEVFTDYKGMRIYYCCPGCDKTFLKSPDKFLAQMKADGVTPAKLQAKCPVSGDAIDKEIFGKTSAGNIYVCCKKCKTKVEASPEKYIEQLKKANIVIGAASVEKVDHKDHDHSKHDH